jgi:hypothetical protein
MTWTSSTSPARPCGALRPLVSDGPKSWRRSKPRAHFYKSMTSHGDHRIWQDLYHVPSEAGTLYVKFAADVVTEFLLLSFKEKDDD